MTTEMSIKRRLIWIVCLMVVQSFYFPLNRLLTGGVAPHLPLDEGIPLWPAWVLPYAAVTVWWYTAYLWAGWKMEARLLRSFVLGAIFILLISQVIFFTLPTYVIRPDLDHGGFWEFWLRMIYSNDKPYNAFPSLHVAITFLISLFWGIWFPRTRWLQALVLALVMCSTVFTKQHYWLDLIGGLGMGVAGSLVSLWVWRKQAAPKPLSLQQH